MNKEELEKCVNNGDSISQIAKKFKKGNTTIRYWLKKYNLKTKFLISEKEILVNKIKQAVEDSLSLSQVCQKLGRPTGGNGYQNLKSIINEYNIDTSHFNIHHYANNTVKIPPDDILVYNRNNGRREKSSRLKRAMIEKGVTFSSCSICNQPDMWNDKKLVLQIDHENGDRLDNNLENLRVVCPNCHSQTENFCM